MNLFLAVSKLHHVGLYGSTRARPCRQGWDAHRSSKRRQVGVYAENILASLTPEAWEWSFACSQQGNFCPFQNIIDTWPILTGRIGHRNMSTYQSPSRREQVGDRSFALEVAEWLIFPRDIVLPVAALLKQYKDNPNSSMIRHFDLMFIQQSIGKLSSKVPMLNCRRSHFTNTNLGATGPTSYNSAWFSQWCWKTNLCHSIQPLPTTSTSVQVTSAWN